MKIEYRKNSNLLEASSTFLVHGCNAQGVMGSGVAGALRASYPEVFETYNAVYRRDGSLQLGDIVWAKTGDSRFFVGNMITQQFYGREAGRVYVSYEAVEMGMIRLDAFFEGRRSCGLGLNIRDGDYCETCAMPLIGAGLAGGSWTKIAEIIERCSRNFRPVVYLLDDKIPST